MKTCTGSGRTQPGEEKAVDWEQRTRGMSIHRLPEWCLLVRYGKHAWEAQFVWQPVDFAEMDFEFDNDGHPNRKEEQRGQPPQPGQGGKGGSAPGRNREAMVVAEEAEVESLRKIKVLQRRGEQLLRCPPDYSRYLPRCATEWVTPCPVAQRS